MGEQRDAPDISPLFSFILLYRKLFLSPAATDKIFGSGCIGLGLNGLNTHTGAHQHGPTLWGHAHLRICAAETHVY